jgi:hypothetical protein
VSRRESWIEQVRRRLADRPARQPLVADAARSALLVPLSVDAGALWTLLAVPEPGSAAASDEGPSFPSGPIAPGQEVWDAALAAAGERLGVAPGVVLRLGELEELEGPNGGLVTPCVGALPAGLATRPGPGVPGLPGMDGLCRRSNEPAPHPARRVVRQRRRLQPRRRRCFGLRVRLQRGGERWGRRLCVFTQ